MECTREEAYSCVRAIQLVQNFLKIHPNSKDKYHVDVVSFLILPVRILLDFILDYGQAKTALQLLPCPKKPIMDLESVAHSCFAGRYTYFYDIELQTVPRSISVFLDISFDTNYRQTQ